MKHKLISIAFLLFLINISFAQQPTKQEKLLNGLKLLIWSDEKASGVNLKLRIHKGAAFDLKDKAGMMSLLADILFPDEQAKRLFREELGGNLSVQVSYDYIQIEASSEPEDLLTLLEAVASAVSNPPITKDNFKKVLDAKIDRLNDLEQDDEYRADVAVRQRLFGSFPYGRPIEGSDESLRKIELADLIFAKDRYLTADNATLVIYGKLSPDFTYMAVRRIFGSWKKSEKPIPATFRQPDEPDTSLLLLNSKADNLIEARSAVRGIARNDRNYFATEILAKILSQRIISQPAKMTKAMVINQANFLPGILMARLSMPKVSVSIGTSNINPTSENSRTEFSLTELLRKDATQEEFEKAKGEVLKDFNSRPIYDLWLDVDTYGLISLKDEVSKANSVSLRDVNLTLQDLRKRPVVNVVLTK
ncbi:MAG: insulinase family protein [Acidobacteria bacterium]|nr:MAG: insulinase family protein [Acidobacteriota bacterium]